MSKTRNQRKRQRVRWHRLALAVSLIVAAASLVLLAKTWAAVDAMTAEYKDANAWRPQTYTPVLFDQKEYHAALQRYDMEHQLIIPRQFDSTAKGE